jgi:hypothetical protein
MMDPKDAVVSREMTDAELEGIIGGMGRARARREAKSNKGKGTSPTPGMTVRTTTPVIYSTPITTTPTM